MVAVLDHFVLQCEEKVPLAEKRGGWWKLGYFFQRQKRIPNILANISMQQFKVHKPEVEDNPLKKMDGQWKTVFLSEGKFSRELGELRDGPLSHSCGWLVSSPSTDVPHLGPLSTSSFPSVMLLASKTIQRLTIHTYIVLHM